MEKRVDQKVLWQTLLPELRECVERRSWNVSVLCDHLRVSKPTMAEWVSNTMPPDEQLIRLWYVLDTLGYHVTFGRGQQTPTGLFVFIGKMLAFRLWSEREVWNYLRLSSNPRAVYKVLRGDRILELSGEGLEEKIPSLERCMRTLLANDRQLLHDWG